MVISNFPCLKRNALRSRDELRRKFPPQHRIKKWKHSSAERPHCPAQSSDFEPFMSRRKSFQDVDMILMKKLGPSSALFPRISTPPHPTLSTSILHTVSRTPKFLGVNRVLHLDSLVIRSSDAKAQFVALEVRCQEMSTSWSKWILTFSLRM